MALTTNESGVLTILSNFWGFFPNSLSGTRSVALHVISGALIAGLVTMYMSKRAENAELRQLLSRGAGGGGDWLGGMTGGAAGKQSGLCGYLCQG
jgi:hypothetical protein